MKSCRRMAWVTAIVVTFVPAMAAQPSSMSEVLIPFTARIAATDLIIERVSAAIIGKQVKITVKYVSGFERHLSLFDPPGGATLMVRERGALKPGTGEVTLLVPAEKLRRAAAITLGFFAQNADGGRANFIFLDVSHEAARPVFGVRSGPTTTFWAASRGGILNAVPEDADVRWKDVSSLSDLSPRTIATLTFNQHTRWSIPAAEASRDILRRGMEPGLGVKSLHQAGITGVGVSVGVIDQNMFLDHPEFKDRIAQYHDVGCNASRGSMHAPAVASLLAGKTIGTAPGAQLYFVAAPSWTRDAKYQADALHWLLDVSATLPQSSKIRVVSVSAAPSGDGSPFTKNNELWDAACAAAEKAGVLVLDCTAHRGVIGAGYYDPAAPDDVLRMQPAYPSRNPALRGKRIMTPMAHRTVAEEYVKGEYGYQYDGKGGLSWAIPYAAGVLAMGWQVNPQLSGEQMIALLRQTAYEKDGVKFINPVAFVEAVKATCAGASQPPPALSPRSIPSGNE